MRILSAAVLVVASIAAARAADLPFERSGETYSTRQTAVGIPAGSVVVYDFHSGVVVRSYWRTPWRNRHYFPVTGVQPEFGRDEDLSAPRDIPEPAQSFRRHWSTTSAFESEAPRRVPRFDADRPPTNSPMPPLPPLK